MSLHGQVSRAMAVHQFEAVLAQYNTLVCSIAAVAQPLSMVPVQCNMSNTRKGIHKGFALLLKVQHAYTLY
jgi:hypothetical protein